MSYVIEQYFSAKDDKHARFYYGESGVLIRSFHIAVKNSKDYEARSNIVWLATWRQTSLQQRKNQG